MMDKQRQIEEMAEDLQYCIVYQSDDSWQPVFNEFAEKFYNEGYRKIPENAVVLTREEKDEIINFLVKRKVQYFAERVKMAFYYEFDELIPSIMADKIDEICKETIGEEK